MFTGCLVPTSPSSICCYTPCEVTQFDLHLSHTLLLWFLAVCFRAEHIHSGLVHIFLYILARLTIFRLWSFAHHWLVPSYTHFPTATNTGLSLLQRCQKHHETTRLQGHSGEKNHKASPHKNRQVEPQEQCVHLYHYPTWGSCIPNPLHHQVLHPLAQPLCVCILYIFSSIFVVVCLGLQPPWRFYCLYISVSSSITFFICHFCLFAWALLSFLKRLYIYNW